MHQLNDAALRLLFRDDPDRAWDAFIEQYTPTLLALIERAGVLNKDEAMDLYVRVCERLADRNCERLRNHDPEKGTLSSWLVVVVRNVAVDWVRSRVGRRRLFGCIKELPAFEQRVFELYYWDDKMPTEIVGTLGSELRREVAIVEVFDALGRIESVLTERHRTELLSMATRARPAVPLDDPEGGVIDPPAPAADPEAAMGAQQINERFGAALAELPQEDAAIVRLKYVQGLTNAQIKKALHLKDLSEERVKAILDNLRAALTRSRIGVADIETPGLAFMGGTTE